MNFNPTSGACGRVGPAPVRPIDPTLNDLLTLWWSRTMAERQRRHWGGDSPPLFDRVFVFRDGAPLTEAKGEVWA